MIAYIAQWDHKAHGTAANSIQASLPIITDVQATTYHGEDQDVIITSLEARTHMFILSNLYGEYRIGHIVQLILDKNLVNLRL